MVSSAVAQSQALHSVKPADICKPCDRLQHCVPQLGTVLVKIQKVNTADPNLSFLEYQPSLFPQCLHRVVKASCTQCCLGEVLPTWSFSASKIGSCSLQPWYLQSVKVFGRLWMDEGEHCTTWWRRPLLWSFIPKVRTAFSLIAAACHRLWQLDTAPISPRFTASRWPHVLGVLKELQPHTRATQPVIVLEVSVTSGHLIGWEPDPLRGRRPRVVGGQDTITCNDTD